MSVNTWIVVAGNPAIGNLIETARSLGGQVSAAVVGPRAVADTVASGGVDKVIWFGEPGQAPVEAYASAVADAVGAASGAVLGASRAGDRVLLGAVAARLQAPVLTEASSLSAWRGRSGRDAHGLRGHRPLRVSWSPDRWPSCSTAAPSRPPAARRRWKRSLPSRSG